ncbi:MAG TPA: type II toxin-antitoxin system RelE/ParE family toxin [Gammaproteobacteria bacterium]
MYKVLLTEEFQSWLDRMSDHRGRIRIAARIRRAELGNLGDWKAIGDRLCEMRINEGPGYRVYFARRRTALIVLLAGGDKSTQQRDIRRAFHLLSEIDNDYE